MPNYKKRRGNNRKRYVAKKKHQKKVLKGTNEADMDQDFRINKIEKTLKGMKSGMKQYLFLQPNPVTLQSLDNTPGDNTIQLSGLAVLGDQMTMQAGDQFDMRQGNHVEFTHVGIRYHIRIDPAAPGVSPGDDCIYLCRVLLITYHMPNGQPGDEGQSVAPDFRDIFAVLDNTTLTESDILLPYTRVRRSNFKVWYDKTYQLNQTFESSTQVQLGQGYISVYDDISVVPTGKWRTQTYNSDVNAGDENVAQNQWYLIAFTNIPSTSEATVPVQMKIRGIVDFRS